MAAGREFQCPKCGHRLSMSDEMHMVALMYQGGGSFMGFGSFDLRDSIHCPRCKALMRIEDVVAGRLKPRIGVGTVALNILVWAALIGGIFLLVRSCSA